MGKRGRKGSFWKKNCLTLIGGGILLLLITAAVITISSLVNPYRSILNRAGVAVEGCKRSKKELTLTFEGDALGILS